MNMTKLDTTILDLRDIAKNLDPETREGMISCLNELANRLTDFKKDLNTIMDPVLSADVRITSIDAMYNLKCAVANAQENYKKLR